MADLATEVDPLVVELRGDEHADLAGGVAPDAAVTSSEYGRDDRGRCVVARRLGFGRVLVSEVHYEYVDGKRIGRQYDARGDDLKLEAVSVRRFVDGQLRAEDRYDVVFGRYSAHEFDYEDGRISERRRVGGEPPVCAIDVVHRGANGAIARIESDGRTIWSSPVPRDPCSVDHLAASMARDLIATLNTAGQRASGVLLLRYTGAGTWSDAAWPSFSYVSWDDRRRLAPDEVWDWWLWTTPEIPGDLSPETVSDLDSLDGHLDLIDGVPGVLRAVAELVSVHLGAEVVVVAADDDLVDLAQALEKLPSYDAARLRQEDAD